MYNRNKLYHTNCHWFAEDRDMGATIPYCRLKNPLGCLEYCFNKEEDYDCEDYITRKQVDELVKSYA